MRLSHPLLILASAGALWWGGHGLWTASLTAQEARSAPAVFGIPGSAYGSLMARLMRDSLYSYWHGGQSAAIPASAPEAKPTAPSVAAPATAAPPGPPAGRFARPGQAAHPAQGCVDVCCKPEAAAVATAKPWLEQRVDDLTRLEAQRTKRNSTFPMSAAHRRFVEASADWRLRLAYQLDPGDAILYEILHFHMASRMADKPNLQQQLAGLAQQAIDNVERPYAGMSAALTGAGAAVNLLNHLLRPEEKQKDREAIRRRWHQLDRCLGRYHELRRQSTDEGWWERIPPSRQNEIDNHGVLLGRIAENIRKQMAAELATADVVVPRRGQEPAAPLATRQQ